jgi:hypothetical protein
MKFIVIVTLIFVEHSVIAQTKLPDCQGNEAIKWNNCYGSTTYVSGNKYTGEWKDGKRHGSGTFEFINGEKYIGEYKNDKREGQGRYIIPNGDQYIGQHKDGKYNGQGTYTEANGNKYSGEWKDGYRNGQGTYTWADGNKYVGEWKNNSRAKGILFLSNGNKLTGNFVNGNLNGQGIFSYSNGNKYDGEFIDGFKNGRGTYTYANGTKYVGEFKDDKRNGYGKEFNSNGSVTKEGEWKNGILLDSDKNTLSNNTNSSNSKSVAKNDAQPTADQDTRNLNQAHGSCLATVLQAGSLELTKAMSSYYDRHNPRIKSLSFKVNTCMAGKIDNATNHMLCVKNTLNSSDADFYTANIMILQGNNNLINKNNAPSFLMKYCTYKGKFLLIDK